MPQCMHAHTAISQSILCAVAMIFAEFFASAVADVQVLS